MARKQFANRNVRSFTVQQLKRYGYSAMIGLALAGMGTVLLFGSPTFAIAPATATFDHYVYPGMIVLGGLVVWAMLRGRLPVEMLEKPLIVIGSCLMVIKYSFTLLSVPDMVSLAHVESWYWMMLGLWVGGFVAFPFFTALVINLTVYASMTGVTLLNAWTKTDGPVFWEWATALSASNFRLGGALAAVILLGYVKQQWVQVENEAMLLRNIAHQDALTGLPNRRWLSETLSDAVAAAAEPLTIILFDLDGFKRVNDRFGHNAGDAVLQQIGDLAQHTVRGADALGRWGGEEFLIICPNTRLGEGIHLAEQLRHTLASDLVYHGHTVTGSFGVAQLQPGETAEQLVARADAAMYAAKKQGKNRVCSSFVDRPSTSSPSTPSSRRR